MNIRYTLLGLVSLALACAAEPASIDDLDNDAGVPAAAPQDKQTPLGACPYAFGVSLASPGGEWERLTYPQRYIRTAYRPPESPICLYAATATHTLVRKLPRAPGVCRITGLYAVRCTNVPRGVTCPVGVRLAARPAFVTWAPTGAEQFVPDDWSVNTQLSALDPRNVVIVSSPDGVARSVRCEYPTFPGVGGGWFGGYVAYTR